MSEESRKKISLAKKGQPSHWKGKMFPKETRKKMSLAKRGYIPWNKGVQTGQKPQNPFRKGHKPWNKGVPQTREVKRKLSESKKGKYGGEKSPVWKGGMMAYQKKQAKKRDNYTCQKCEFYSEEFKGSAVDIDHILSKHKYPELKTELDNLITLCPTCHRIKSLKENDYIH